MRTIFITLVVFCSLFANAQTIPTLVIDNIPIKFQGDISLPYWVGAGKSVQLGQNAVTASILEFTLVNNEMEFSQAIHFTSIGTVPTGKVWKIEAIGIGNNSNYNSINNFSNSNYPSIFNSPITFSTPGTYTWTVPPGVTNICIEAWGGGGRGGDGYVYNNYSGYSGGGGGGGGYGYQCFTVIPGTTYNVIVGAGSTGSGSGGTSSFGTLISVTGGQDGSDGTLTTPGVYGTGGSSSSNFYINGENGAANKGGKGANGGIGGTAGSNGGLIQATQGTAPGGGGGPGDKAPNSSSNLTYSYGKSGAGGQIKIYF